MKQPTPKFEKYEPLPFYSIVKGIPIPEKEHAGGRKFGNPIMDTLKIMVAGDSFVLKWWQCGAARDASKRLHIKVVYRRINDSEVRVWKV